MEVRKDRITEYIGTIDDVAIGASRHSTIFGRERSNQPLAGSPAGSVAMWQHLTIGTGDESGTIASFLLLMSDFSLQC